jgi:hypothetical protein
MKGFLELPDLASVDLAPTPGNQARAEAFITSCNARILRLARALYDAAFGIHHSQHVGDFETCSRYTCVANREVLEGWRP